MSKLKKATGILGIVLFIFLVLPLVAFKSAFSKIFKSKIHSGTSLSNEAHADVVAAPVSDCDTGDKNDCDHDSGGY